MVTTEPCDDRLGRTERRDRERSGGNLRVRAYTPGILGDNVSLNRVGVCDTLLTDDHVRDAVGTQNNSTEKNNGFRRKPRDDNLDSVAPGKRTLAPENYLSVVLEVSSTVVIVIHLHA